MRLKHLVSVLLLWTALLGTAATAHAEEPDAFRNYELEFDLISLARQGDLAMYGGKTELAVHLNERFAVIADITVHRRAFGLSSLDAVTYKTGPRVSAHWGTDTTLYGQALAGGARLIGNVELLDTKFTVLDVGGLSFSAGVGADIAVRPWFAVRAIHVDYNMLRFSPNAVSHGLIIGTGVVFRMGREKR